MTTIVFCAYGIPRRLKEHFEWNDAVYREHGLRVVVVTEKEYPLPEYARCAVYPHPLPAYSAAKCTNFGLSVAKQDAPEVIVRTDADVAFIPEHMEAILHPKADEAVVPVYLLVPSFALRLTRFYQHNMATGTIAMTLAYWQRFSYDERFTGYGWEDTLLVWQLGRELKVIRQQPVWHVEHKFYPNWLRMIGTRFRPRHNPKFNEDRMEENRRLYERIVAEQSKKGA